MSKYILLTGGTGFIGSHLLEELLNQNKKVILLKRSFSNTWRINEFLENDNLILKDTDKIQLESIFSCYDIKGTIHLAAFSERTHKSDSITKMIDSNITFPTRILENSVNYNTKYFINTGSFFEYSLNKSPISEKSKLKSFNLYGSTKIAFENILKYYYESYDLNCQTLKLFTPYGPKDNEIKIIPYLIINSILKNNIIIKSPSKRLDFIYVSDIINSYTALLNNLPKLKEYNSFNVGTGTGTTINDVFKIIERKLGTNKYVKYSNIEKDQVWCSNEKIKKILKWNPKIKVEDGIELTIRYYMDKYG